MTRKTLLTLAVLTALSAGTAFAATQPAVDGAPTATRVKLDANGDGSIDRKEAAAQPRLAAKFDLLDKNKDGRISKEEMPARGQRGHHQRGDDKRGHDPRGQGKSGDGSRMGMASLDTNKDGRISREEAAAGQAKSAERFERMDVNKDGFIDRADHELRTKQRADAWFATADTDKDGKLSRAEFDAAKAKHSERGPRSPAAKPGV